MADIMAVCNIDDPLARYMTKKIFENWSSYRDGCVRFLQQHSLTAATLTWVAETDEDDEVPYDADGKTGRGGEVVGWAIWSRHGDGNVARNWQRQTEGRLIRKA